MLYFHSAPHSKTFLEPSIDMTSGSPDGSVTDPELDSRIILSPGWGSRAALSVLTHYLFLYPLTFI